MDHAPRSIAPRTALNLWVWLVFALYLAACLHEAFGPFLVGHDGYNGAAFSQAARNSLRFGILEQVQYYTGLDRPPLAEVYTNHPMLLHLHLIGLFSLTGVEAWAARLIPIAYSLAFFILLFRVTLRRAGRLEAALAITLWTLTPLHTIFANMVNHEQGGLFWCLFLVDRYLTLIDPRRDGPTTTGHTLPIYIAVSAAMQFDWTGYYFAFFIGLHSLARTLSAHSHLPLPQRLHRLGFTLRFSAVVLLNAAAFFGWIAWLRGGLAPMADAFTQRSATFSGYLPLLYHRALDLYGAALLALLAAWLLFALWRLLTRRATPLDLIPWSFALAQLIHSAVFQSAGAIHVYWTFYAGPALAIGGALTLAALLRAPRRPALRALTVAALLLATALQARYAYARHHWGYATHRAAYLPPDEAHDDWVDAHWAADLHRRYGREDVCFLIHPSAERPAYFIYYLDAPLTFGFDILHGARVEDALTPHCRRPVLLFDLQRIPLHNHAHLQNLTRDHRTLVWERRFLAIDTSQPTARPPDPDPPAPTGPPPIEAWLFEPRPSPWWWPWLVSSRNPPADWVPDPDAASLIDRLLFATESSAGRRWAGGYEGFHQRLRCPEGTAVDALDVRLGDGLVVGLGLRCLAVDGLHPDGPPEPLLLDGGFVGQRGRGREPDVTCPFTHIAGGLHGRAGLAIDALGLICSPPRHQRGFHTRRDSARSFNARFIGSWGGIPFTLFCPSGERLIGLDTHRDWRIVSLSPICTPQPDLTPSSPPAPFEWDLPRGDHAP